MGSIRGFALDGSLHTLAKDLVEMKKGGIALDIDQTIENWNAKHKLADSTAELQNDLKLFVTLEEQRQLKSMSANGFLSYKADPLVEKAKQLAKNFLGELDPAPKKT